MTGVLTTLLLLMLAAWRSGEGDALGTVAFLALAAYRARGVYRLLAPDELDDDG